NVTIFGESAGGMSVSTLLGTPMARGLFAKAIAQSGGPVGVLSGAGEAVVEELTTQLGRSASEVGELRSVPVEALVGAQAVVAADRMRTAGGLAFTPVVDGVVLPKPPLAAIRR